MGPAYQLAELRPVARLNAEGPGGGGGGPQTRLAHARVGVDQGAGGDQQQRLGPVGGGWHLQTPEDVIARRLEQQRQRRAGPKARHRPADGLPLRFPRSYKRGAPDK